MNIDVNPATFFYSEAVHQKILLNKANHQLNVGDFNQMVLKYQYLIFLVNSHQLSVIVIKIIYIFVHLFGKLVIRLFIYNEISL